MNFFVDWFLYLLRNLYETFVEEMIVSPGSKVKAVSRIDVTLDDHVRVFAFFSVLNMI